MNKSVILCVDDEKVVLTSLKAQLKNKLSSDFVIETAENGKDALDIFNEYHKKNVDIPVVIADHIMPGMRGDELLIRIHEISKKTYNIMLTGQANAEAVGNAVNNARLYRYIAKPWDSNDLNLTVIEAINVYNKDKKINEQQTELENLVRELKIYNEQLELKVKERTTEIVRQKSEIEKNLEKVKQLNHELYDKNTQITDSIKYARIIQNAVLPAIDYIDELLSENFILYKPKEILSGDFYWVRHINQFIVIVITDCTGHGVPGALMSMLGISFLNEIVQKREITQANQALNELRKHVKQALHQTGKKGEADDGMDLVLCVLDTKTNMLQYAGAVNPLYLVQNGELNEIKADRMPIGFYPNEKPSFTNHEIQLKEGDILYLFTDGFIDQFGGEKGNKYNVKKLQEKLLEIHEKPMIIQKELLEQELTNWMRGYQQTDDILVMGLRV
jgi:sigma-B regulation protein RsbU (phosphoserine phosphatase)